MIDDGLVEEIKSNKKIVKYLDIPLQHSEDRILKLMNRPVGREKYLSLFAKLRKEIPEIAIRSTFITGFPSETEEEFNSLCGFLYEAQLDNCGFFAYSQEDGTPASRLSGQIEEDVKLQRQERLYALQENVMIENMKSRLGKQLDVLYEGIDYDMQMFYGRSMFDAPQIDTNIYFVADKPLEIGRIYKVLIEELDGEDYIGRAVFD